MTLLDANLLLYAIDEQSPFHDRIAHWLTDQLNGERQVGFPWVALSAFVRIATHPRATQQPMTARAAWDVVSGWLDCDVAWTPGPGPRHRDIFGGFVTDLHLTSNVITDAHLAAIAIEHGLTIYSNDSDFARFPGLSWTNPLT